MGDVRPFPTPPRSFDADDMAELREMFSAEQLTRAELVDGPVDRIRAAGPWVAPADSLLSDHLLRVQAIVQGLLGPGRVPLKDGLEVAIELLDELRCGVKR